MDAEKLGAEIAVRRRELGLTQRELAQMLHVTDGAISKWERGINFPELTLLEPLAAALKTNVVELLSLEQASNHEVAEALSVISNDEKKKLVKQLRARAWFQIVIEIMLLAALLYASKVFADNNIYGMAQVTTMGMLGFVGILIGSELYAIRHLPKLF